MDSKNKENKTDKLEETVDDTIDTLETDIDDKIEVMSTTLNDRIDGLYQAIISNMNRNKITSSDNEKTHSK